MVHCGTDNLNHNEPKAMGNDIIKIGIVIQKKLTADFNLSEYIEY